MHGRRTTQGAIIKRKSERSVVPMLEIGRSLLLYFELQVVDSLYTHHVVIQSLRRLSRLSSAVGLITATHRSTELQTIN